MNPTQTNISNVVKDYMEMFPKEYDQFCNSIAHKRELQKDEYSKVDADTVLQQFVYEIPETLYFMFGRILTEEDGDYLDSKEGAEWFGRTFKQFSTALKI